MFKRLGYIALASVCVLAVPASARAQQTLNFSLGYFTVRGEDARVQGDQIAFDRKFLSFNVPDFNGATIGAEWLIPIGDYFEGGAGIRFSRRTVPSVYTNYTDTTNSEIEQQLRLRIVPVDFSFRVLPLGQTTPVQPYVGAGIGVYSWRYSESGDFIDFAHNNAVYRATYAASGTASGPIAMGGIRFSGDTATAGFEVRYQKGEGKLPLGDFGDATLNRNPKIDLGGWSYLFTAGLRFH